MLNIRILKRSLLLATYLEGAMMLGLTYVRICILVLAFFMPAATLGNESNLKHRDQILGTLNTCGADQCLALVRDALLKMELHSQDRFRLLSSATEAFVAGSLHSETGIQNLRKTESLLKIEPTDLTQGEIEKTDFLGNKMSSVTDRDLAQWRTGLLSKVAKTNDRLGQPLLAASQFRTVIEMLDEQGTVKQKCNATGNTYPAEVKDMLAVGALTELKILLGSIAEQCRLQLARTVGFELKRLGNSPSAIAISHLLPNNLKTLYMEELFKFQGSYPDEIIKKIYE